MTNEVIDTKPERIFEYAAFFEVPVTLYPGDNFTAGLIVQIKEVLEGEVVAKIRGRSSRDDLRKLGNDIRAVMRYKGKALNFNLVLAEDQNQDKQLFSFKLPAEFFFIDKRKYIRAELMSKADLVANVKIRHRGDDYSFETSDFLCISPRDITLFLPEPESPFSIGDKVISLRIFNKGKLIMDGQGSIIKTGPWPGVEKGNVGYVISFERPIVANVKEKDALPHDRRISDQRLNFDVRKGAFVEFLHPLFTSYKLFGEIEDISTSGISFSIKKSKFPILAGMQLHDFQIQLPTMTRHITTLRVLYAENVVNSDEYKVKVGGEFINLSIDLLRDISSTANKNNIPNLTEATIEDRDSLWEFFFEVGFIYGRKQIQMKKNSHKIYDTFSKLLSADSNISKMVLFKVAGEVKGHISTVRFFDSSWIIQHFSAKPTSQSLIAGRAMIHSMNTFFRNPRANNLTSTKFLATYYRPENIYPAAVFNGVVKVIDDPMICSAQDYKFCLPGNEILASGSLRNVSSASSPREANFKDLQYLGEILKMQNRVDVIDSEDWKAESFCKLNVSEEFERLGLYRYRKVFVIDGQKSNTRVFAICNYSSPGINLSELTNSFKIISNAYEASDYSSLLTSLTETVVDSYFSTEVKSPVLLLETNQEVPSSYREEKIYTCWRLNVAHADKFAPAIDAVFNNIKKYIRLQKSVLGATFSDVITPVNGANS